MHHKKVLALLFVLLFIVIAGVAMTNIIISVAAGKITGGIFSEL